MTIKASEPRQVSETRFSLLEAKVGGLEVAFHEMSGKLETWMANRGTNPWRVIALILGILVPLGFIMNLYITSAISPWAAVANQAKATAEANTITSARLVEDMGIVKSQNAASIQDRLDGRATMTKGFEIQTSILERFARTEAERQANEREVETQIDAMNQSLSIQFANQQRINADFQNALHDMGAKYPQAPGAPFYFPNISNRNHRKQ